MVCLARPLGLLSVSLLLACAGGGGNDPTANSGFSVGNPSSPSAPGDTSFGETSADGDTTMPIRPTGDLTERPPTTDEPATTGVDPSGVGLTSSSGVDDTTAAATTADTSDDTTGPVILCGNMVIDANEECDGADLNAKTCMTFGFTGGALQCSPQCIFDKSMCTSPSCGDGTLDGNGEECDCGNQGQNCTAAQLGNKACTTLPSPNGGNYSGGTLTCNSPVSCSFNKAACTYCGDGVRNAAEACDSADLGGQTCQTQGFNAGGLLGCTAQCTFNTNGCQNMVCGDGQCQNGEDSCSCPGDCPDDINSCSPCECGDFGGACYCDAACVNFGDCCFNGPC